MSYLPNNKYEWLADVASGELCVGGGEQETVPYNK